MGKLRSANDADLREDGLKELDWTWIGGPLEPLAQSHPFDACDWAAATGRPGIELCALPEGHIPTPKSISTDLVDSHP